MRILCLHGNGTNSNVMRLQTAPLRHELEDNHEYEFVEAVLQAPMSEGIEGLCSPESSFYAFYNPENLHASLRCAIDQLNDYIQAEGPFDAVMGFSAGAVLAALYLLGKQQTEGQGGRWAGNMPRCGIFLSSASCRAEANAMGSSVHEPLSIGRMLIQIPTVHIWGSNDATAPTGGEDLSRICDSVQRLVLVHDGGHELPRGDFLTKAVHLIRRTIDQAETSEK